MGKGEETRTQILERALALASTEGLGGISIGALARDVGLSMSGLFAHFGSKEDLQLEVLRTAVERFVETVVRPALARPRGAPRVRGLFEGWLAWSRAAFLPGGCLFVASANELDDQPGPLRDFLVRAQRDWVATLATAARLAVAEGHFRADVDPQQFAQDLWGLLLSQHFFERLLRDDQAATRSRASFERLMAAAAVADRPL
jgi:AcrR family transcriptional regulator